MEKVTLEQIDLLMERANVSYADAKEALEQANGDIVSALLYLEKADKIKKQPASNYQSKLRSFWDKLNASSFVMKKADRTFINVPGSIALIGMIICLPFSLIALILAMLVFGIKVSVTGENEASSKINDALNAFQK